MPHNVCILTHEPVTATHLAELTAVVRVLQSDLPPVRREHIEAMTNEGSVILVAETHDGSLVGIATLIYYHELPYGRVATIETVAVLEAHQRTGIGDALMVRMLGIARQGGAAHVTLSINPTRGTTHQFYARHGFVKQGTDVLKITLSNLTASHTAS